MTDYSNPADFEQQQEYDERVIEIARVAKVVRAAAGSTSASRSFQAITAAALAWVSARRTPSRTRCVKPPNGRTGTCIKWSPWDQLSLTLL